MSYFLETTVCCFRTIGWIAEKAAKPAERKKALLQQIVKLILGLDQETQRVEQKLYVVTPFNAYPFRIV